MNMVLGIDPGTHCGWALLRYDGTRVASGVWNLAPRKGQGAGMRAVNLRKNLRDIFDSIPAIDRVYYERVRRHMGTDAAHVYGGIVDTLTGWCEENNVDSYDGVEVGIVKKCATGKGNAGKPEMIKAARDRWGIDPETDDEADACFVALAGLRQ